GNQPRALAFAGKQRLFPIQEKHLADWVRIQHALRLPLSHRQLKDFTERILQIAGDHRPLGRN
ncbi:transposase, partial [Colletotrichum incanum]